MALIRINHNYTLQYYDKIIQRKIQTQEFLWIYDWVKKTLNDTQINSVGMKYHKCKIQAKILRNDMYVFDIFTKSHGRYIMYVKYTYETCSTNMCHNMTKT